MKDRTILGLVEDIEVYSPGLGKTIKMKARIDTGAQSSSIDQNLAAEFSLGPIIKNKKIRQSHGRSLRPVVKVKVLIEGEDLEGEFTISDRTHMTYKVLIGQDILKKGFLIDPSK
ncbi:MAG: RimK/LysX family protein [Nanobdellota archaeon]